MAAGLGLLRLEPRAFWAMTPKELSAAFGALAGLSIEAPPSRAEVAAMMRRFPDADPHGALGRA